jgi:hypothetical protein
MMELKDVVPLGERSSSHAIDPSDRVRHNLACPIETLHHQLLDLFLLIPAGPDPFG